MFSDKSQLEKVFIECLSTVRQDVWKRRMATQPHGKERDIMQTDMDDKTLEGEIPFDKFSSSDKRKVVDLLFSNEDVLLFL